MSISGWMSTYVGGHIRICSSNADLNLPTMGAIGTQGYAAERK